MVGGIWSDTERRAWCPPEKLSTSQWVERNRVLPASVAAESGQLRLSRTPYIVGMLNAIDEPGVEEIICLKSTQIGWSTLTESLIGLWIDGEPGPILLCLDSEKTAKEVMSERIRPLVENTPAVAQHLTPYAHDSTLDSIRFDTCSLYTAWSGSPGTLARRAIRYAIFDEVDKYRANGKEADAISLGIERTATYGYRRRVLIGSTPTTRQGVIWRAYQAAGDKRRYHVPCPHCSTFQPLIFGQIKWPKLALDDSLAADTIEQQSLAHYECAKCRLPIRESAKPKILARGVWLSETQSIDEAGVISGKRPRAKRLGFWINAIYSPWRSFSAIAAEFIRSQRDPHKLQNFRNSWLAEPHEEIVKSATVEDIRQLTSDAPAAKLVPTWAEYVVVSADVQKDRMYWIVRAWGAGCQSQLIDYGICASFEALHEQTLNAQFALASGGTSQPHAMFVDAHHRTDEVYAFSKTDERIYPVMGANDSQKMLIVKSTAAHRLAIQLYTLNTQMLKDRLAVYQNTPGKWLLNDEVEDIYLQHLAAEQKVAIDGNLRWTPKSNGIPNHYLDCEVYQLAGAEVLQVDKLESIEVKADAKASVKTAPPIEMEEITRHQQYEKQRNSFLGNTKGWLNG